MIEELMSTDSIRTMISDAWIVDKLSEWGITFLTDVQQKAVAAGILQGKSMIVSAPTSSGKTLIAELATLAATRSGGVA
jgi:helicase